MSTNVWGSPANIFDFTKSEIYRTFGDVVEINRKSIHKFGKLEDPSITAQDEVNDLTTNETYLTTNGVTHVSATNVNDTNELYYEGMQIDVTGTIFTFIKDVVTLDGQNSVLLPTPVARLTRTRNLTSTVMLGNAYFHEGTATVGGIPTDLTKIHAKMDGAENTSFKAGTSVASTNYMICCGFYAHMNKQTNGVVKIRFKHRKLGAVFHTEIFASVSQDKDWMQVFNPFLIIEPNSDVIMTAQATTNNLSISSGFHALFADIKSDGILREKVHKWY